MLKTQVPDERSTGVTGTL